MEIEASTRMIPDDSRITFFCECGRHNLSFNSIPSPFVRHLVHMKLNEVLVALNEQAIRIKGRIIFDWIAEDYS
jgi:hypothetical protein